jgi:hypothetical protein
LVAAQPERTIYAQFLAFGENLEQFTTFVPRTPRLA